MDQLVNFIIRPPRADYCPDDLLDQEFMLKGRWFRRKDLEVTNCRGQKLQCSHYMPVVIPEGQSLPCVIYCHGNSGCRADASEAAIILLPSNITVFTLDFSGSGLSDGEHVTLGWNEKDDLRAVVDHLRTDNTVSCIGLWGRSMGAVTSLMYGAEDPSIAGMVLDSPFSNLVDLMMELVDTYKYRVPKFTVKLAIQHMRKIIKKKANFDIMDLDTIQVAKCSFVPVLIGHAIDDDFINPRHSDQIYESYVGDKNIIKFDGDHNAPRPQFYFDSITIFFHNVLNPPKNDFDEYYYFQPEHGIYSQDSHVENQDGSPIGSHQEFAARSTEDSIAILRNRRPLSRMEVPHDVSCQEEQSEDEEHGSRSDLGTSSGHSNLPNGHQHAWLTPSGRDDDYLEYAFDSFSDVPCSIEDEERMLMEAMIESLKDAQLSETQDQAKSSDAFGESSQVSNDPAGASGRKEDYNLITDEKPGNQEPQSIETTTIANSAHVTASNDTVAESNSSTQSADGADGTRATLVVQKNQTSNAIDGLVNRWGLNFFKGNKLI